MSEQGDGQADGQGPDGSGEAAVDGPALVRAAHGAGPPGAQAPADVTPAVRGEPARDPFLVALGERARSGGTSKRRSRSTRRDGRPASPRSRRRHRFIR